MSGNKILDPTGATFTMRGSNILFDTRLDGFGHTPERDVPPMVDKWHLNTVRLLVSEDFWIGSQQTIDGAANPNYCSDYVGYQERIDNWDIRLALRKQTLTTQFTAMETALNALDSQSSWLKQQLSSLPSWSSSSK